MNHQRPILASILESAVLPPAKTLRGRVLLAEDSKENQRALAFYLERLALSVAIAENGRIAVDRGMSEAFDLILMDIQMPVMDGYSATKLLRRLGCRLPIVALTALTMQGVEERCHAAGCDAFLGKPVQIGKLTETLQRQLERSLAMKSTAEPLPSISLRVVAKIPLSSTFAGDEGYLPLLREYVGELPKRFNGIRSAIRDRNLIRVAAEAHKLRGTGGMYGYPELSEAAGYLEDASRERQTLSLIEELVDALELVIKRIKAGLDLRFET